MKKIRWENNRQMMKEFPTSLIFNKYLSKVAEYMPCCVANLIYKWKHKRLMKYLNNCYRPVLDEVKQHYTPVEHHNKIVWVMWYQGIELAPDSVKVCIESIKKALSSNYQLVLLDQYNLTDYISIPSYIFEKVNKQTISLTHFSDFIRTRILEKWGGQWIDATILMTENMDCSIFNSDFYSICTSGIVNEYENGLWTSFCIGGNRSLIFKYMDALWLAYFKEHDVIIEYFLFDYFIQLIMDYDSDVRNMILNNAKHINYEVFDLLPYLKKDYLPSVKQYLNNKDTFMYKLSYKERYIDINSKGYQYVKNYVKGMKNNA